MRRRSTTTGLIIDASLVLQETVGVLSDPERGGAMHTSGTDARSVASCRTSAANYRSELAILPSQFVEEMRLAIISSGQGWCHTRYCPKREELIHTPSASRPEASQKPR